MADCNGQFLNNFGKLNKKNEKLMYNFKKKYLFLTTAILLLFLSSCRKEPEVLFFMEYEIPLSIPAGLNPIDAHFFNFRNVPTNFEPLMESFNLDTSNYVIEPHSAELVAIFNEAEFNFVRDVKIFIIPNYSSSIRHEVFSRENVLLNTKHQLIVFPWQLDVKEFLKQRETQFLLQLNLRGASPTSIETRIKIRFQVRQL